MDIPLRAMTPVLARLSPIEFHMQGVRWERTRERILARMGRTEMAEVAACNARRHERELSLL